MTLRPARRVRDVERTLIRQIFDSAPPDAINLGLGQPDLPTPDVVALAGVAGICHGRTAYTSTAGDGSLRAAVAERYSAGPENVLITVGSQEALFASCLTLLDEGDEMLYPEPGYPAYPTVARLIGARPVPYALRADRGFHLDVEDIARALTGRTRLVIVTAPSNPTGACNTREELQELVRLLERREIAWLSDEIYSAFCYDGEFVSPRDVSADGGLVISGLSKDLSMTGWRIGWVVGPADTLVRAIATHQYLVTCSSSVSQCAALAALSPRGDAQRSRYVEIFRHRRSVMARELSRIPGIRFEVPEGAFYFFVDVSEYGGSREVGRRILERKKVITIPGIAFGKGGEGYLRISFAATDEAIRTGVRRIGSELIRGAGGGS